MLVIGVVLILDALVTIAWQDPFTAVFTQADQKALSKQLDGVREGAAPASTLALVRRARTRPAAHGCAGQQLGDHTKAGEPLGRISIAKVGVNFVFVAGTGENSLKNGPGHYEDNVLPGLRGTVAIAGHRTTYEAPFRHLDSCGRGDRITLTMPYGLFTYSVEGSRVVSPGHTTVLRHVRHDRLVLTTCTPMFSAKQRLVVTGWRTRQAARRGDRVHPDRAVGAPPLVPARRIPDLLLQQGAGEVVGVERAQVLEALADPDQLDGQAHLLGDRQRDAALGGAVELGQHHAGYVHGLLEELRLAQAVLAGGRVDRQQRFVWRPGHLLFDHAPHLGQLLHQRDLGVEPPGRVGDHDVVAAAASGFDRVEDDRTRDPSQAGR